MQAILEQQHLERQAAQVAATLADVSTFASLNLPKHLSASTKTSPSTPPLYANIMSLIGVGIDSNSNNVDATEAAVKAVRDALERGNLLSSQNVRLYIKLGAPVLHNHIMRVNPARLQQVLPNIPLLPIEVEVGGLRISQEGKSTVIVIACVTLQQLRSTVKEVLTIGSPTSVTNSPQLHNHHAPPLPLPPMQQSEAAVHVPKTWAEVEASQQSLPPNILHGFQFTQPRRANSSQPPRNDSMDMLARISAEMINQETDKPAFKKLPPGKTPKNHKRLFVKHRYRDHSQEQPDEDEIDFVKTPNAAFPVKLHETLTQIENDGLDSIVGWLPHGRSFKIKKQKEFVDIILPKYFVMTKKSSFLRQLNLYGFNRLSAPGPDQGRYDDSTL